MEKVGDDVKVNTKPTIKQIEEEHKIQQLQNKHKLSTLIFNYPLHCAISFVIIVAIIVTGSLFYYMCDVWFCGGTNCNCNCNGCIQLKLFLKNLWDYIYSIGLIAFGFFLKHLL